MAWEELADQDLQSVLEPLEHAGEEMALKAAVELVAVAAGAVARAGIHRPVPARRSASACACRGIQADCHHSCG